MEDRKLYEKERQMSPARLVSIAWAAAFGWLLPFTASATSIEYEYKAADAAPIERSLGGDRTIITKVDKNGLPTAATTWMTNAFFAAEHELLHAIGFTKSVDLFGKHLDENPDGSRNFKDGDGKVIAILTPKDEGTHIDASKKVGDKEQSSIMEPDPGGKEAGEFEKLILNSAFNWTGRGGLDIQIKFTGRFEDKEKFKDDREHIKQVVDKIEKLFGRKEGVAPHVLKWDAQGSPVTAITLLYFEAKADSDDSVILTWETVTEVDNAGFNLYRARREDGTYKKLNDALIDAKGNAVSGASYSYVDTPPTLGTYYYKLEDVDYNGVSTMHGPEKVRVRSGNKKGARGQIF